MYQHLLCLHLLYSIAIITYLVGKHFLVAILHGSRKINKQRMLPLLLEAGVELPVSLKRSVDTDLVACAKLADTGFEEVLLDRPAHEVVSNRCLCHLLIELNRLVVVFALQGDKVSRFEPELVSKCLRVRVSFGQKVR